MTSHRCRKGLLLLALVGGATMGRCQTVVPEVDPAEVQGPRPYEMVWADREEPAPSTLRFDHLQGWTLQVEGGAQAELRPSRAQDLWGRPVGRLRYHGNGDSKAAPSLRILPPAPVAVPQDADSLDLWVFGNRWDYANPAGTPAVEIALHLRDADGEDRRVPLTPVRWEEWWLVHRRLPADLKRPAELVSLEVSGGWQAEPRELFFESLRLYHEDLPPLSFQPRPKRNLRLPRGQSAGANTGPGALPFPTREMTILPAQLGGDFRNRTAAEPGGTYCLSYEGKDARIDYRFDPKQGLAGLSAQVDGKSVGRLMEGAALTPASASGPVPLSSVALRSGVVTARYEDGTELRLRVRQKSMIIDIANPTGRVADLSFGRLTGLTEPRAVWIPYITYGGNNPSVLLSRAGDRPVFTSLWLDWYRSNGSEPYGAEEADAAAGTARINGGVRYHPLTDGKRNPLFERLFITVSPLLEETLPTIPNPVGRHARMAVDRLWQESWGPEDFTKEAQRGERLRAYGIEKLIQCNHEIAWRDNGESFTLRVHAAPKKGGDEALQRYVAHQKSLGWYSGLYTNYTDFIAVNEHWTPDAVQRTPEGEWRTAWARSYAEKPLKAVEFDAVLAPQVQARYGSNSAYTDVHTAVAPWAYTDYDARVPGAGTFAQTFYAYGELLRNDSRVYGGPIFSEGTYQWLYAGLADGNYAIAYNGRPLAKEPLLPIFDLLQIHPRECDIGMGWTAYFCDAIPDWTKPENLDRAIDRFLLHTLAYGHLGWLVEETHGIDRACRSYYMLQQVQARYGLKAPSRIAYWDGESLVSTSEAVVRDLPRTRRQLYVAYPGGLELWLNDHPAEDWRVRLGEEEVTLPPAGWAAYDASDGLLSYSGLSDGRKVDYLRSGAYTYLDGRGRAFRVPEGGSDGALALTPLSGNRVLALHISGQAPFEVGRPYGTHGRLKRCEVYDEQGKRLSGASAEDDGHRTRITPVPQGLRYVLTFGD